MLMIWKWNTGSIVYGYADKGVDCAISANDGVGIMVLNDKGESLFYATMGELRKLATFQGYHNPNVKAA